MTRVVFACVHNAGRSQMAAAWFNQIADPAKARAISAGTQPSDHVHPVVVDAMKEKGIDLSKAEPQKLTADHPKGQGIEPVRLIRDEIESRVRALVKEHGWA